MTEDTNLFGEPLPKLGAPLFAEKWDNRKCFWIGVHTSRGLTAQSVCEKLKDGVTPNVITGMWSHWGYASSVGEHTYAVVPVPLSGIHRTTLDTEAHSRGMDIQEICQAVLETVARENLFKAVLE